MEEKCAERKVTHWNSGVERRRDWRCNGISQEKGEKMSKLERINEVLKNAVEEMQKIMKEPEEKEIELVKLKPGDKFVTEIGKFIVLGHDNGTTMVIKEDFFKENVQFDNNTRDYTKSSLKKIFDDEITPSFEKVFGEHLVEHEVDLKSVDMQDYGKFKCKVRPMTFDEAREFSTLIVNENLPDWCWTCTPWSSEKRGYKYSVVVVSPSGGIDCNDCYYDLGVRPFGILRSSIFVSKEN